MNALLLLLDILWINSLLLQMNTGMLAVIGEVDIITKMKSMSFLNAF